MANDTIQCPVCHDALAASIELRLSLLEQAAKEYMDGHPHRSDFECPSRQALLDAIQVRYLTIDFTIPGEPVAKGRARSFARVVGGKAFTRHYTPEKTRQAEMTLAARAMEFRPSTPIAEPIRLFVEFRFAVPESWPHWKRSAAIAGDYQHVTKPDADNCVKLLKDALTGPFWIDDKQICEVTMAKKYDTVPATRVVIITLPHAERN